MATCQVQRDDDGNILYGLAPNGERSLLYDNLVTIFNNDRERALVEWARTYTQSFTDWFGDWHLGAVDASLLSTQGEPRVFDPTTEPHYRNPGGRPHLMMVRSSELSAEERQRILDEVLSPAEPGPEQEGARDPSQPGAPPRDGQAPPLRDSEYQRYENQALDKMVKDARVLVSSITRRYQRALKNRAADGGRSELDKLNQLEENMKNAESLEAMVLFLKDAQDRIRSAHIKMREAVEVLHGSRRSAGDRSRAALNLVRAFQLVKGYEMLQELRAMDVFRNMPEDEDNFSPMTALNELSALYHSMWQTYLHEGRPLLAEFLMDTFDGELNELAARYGKGHLQLTRAKMLDILVEHIDISQSSKWLDPLISTRDDALQLFAKRIKRHVYAAMDEARKDMNEMGPLFEAYAKVAPVPWKDNAKAFYAPMWQTAKVYDNLSDEEVHQRTQAWKKIAKSDAEEAHRQFQQLVPEDFRPEGYVGDEALKGKVLRNMAEAYAQQLRITKESVERAMYVTPWDENAWSEARRKFFQDELPAKMEERARQIANDPKVRNPARSLEWSRKQFIQAFYRANRVAVPNWLELANRRRRSLTLAEFRLWFDEHLFLTRAARQSAPSAALEDALIASMWRNGINESLVTPKGELTIPDPAKFHNAKFEALWGSDIASFYSAIDTTREQALTGDAKKDFYIHLLRKHFDAQERIPNTHYLGWKLPGVRADYLSRLAEGRPAKETLSEWIRRGTTFQLTDTRFGELDLSGELVRDVPVHYTHSLSPGEVSYDLAASSMLFGQMSHNYESLASVREYVTLMGDVIDNRRVIAQNARGQQMVNSIAKKLGVERKLVNEEGGNAAERLREFVTMQYYGAMTERAGVAIPGTDTVIEWNKIADRLASYTTITGLALNVMQGTSNLLIGEIFFAQEAVAGQWYGKRSAAKASQRMAAYWALHWARDHERMHDKSIEGQLMDIYDPLQGDFIDNFGRRITGGAVQKYANTNVLFIMQHIGEVSMQTQTLFSLLEETQVPLRDGSTIPMIQAYTKDRKGNIQRREDVALSEAEWDLLTEKIRNRTHAINKRLHGVYNKFDRSVLQKYWWGRWVMVYRKWIKPGVDRRFMAERLDHEMTDVVEGYYRTTALILSQLGTYRGNVFKLWGSLTPFEKQNVVRTSYEMVMFAGLFLLGRVLMATGEDDDAWIRKFAAYQAVRVRKELSAYVSPQEYLRIAQQPSAVFTLLKDMTEIVAIVMSNPLGRYQQDSGIFDKGDLKIAKHIMDVMPVFKAMQRAGSPEEALELLDPLSSARYGR